MLISVNSGKRYGTIIDKEIEAEIVFLLTHTGQAVYLTLYVKRWKKNKQ